MQTGKSNKYWQLEETWSTHLICLSNYPRPTDIGIDLTQEFSMKYWRFFCGLHKHEEPHQVLSHPQKRIINIQFGYTDY